MKRILAIMGSPRKNGNTHILLLKLLEAGKKVGSQGEMLFLGDLNIKECDGCHSCWKGNECSKNDDMNDIYKKIADSDVLVFGTPVYWYGPTGLMKLFLDRCVFFNCEENNKQIAGKSAVLVVPFEENTLETAKPLVDLFEKSFKYLNLNLIEQLLVPGVYKKGDVLKKKDAINRAIEIGTSIV
ncbi:MAG: flavodoxin family protein [Candidatus Lokiarchaeota archaeon]|nr:flavodoxin family protein [Candidatus Lokiarchaeota archaeon]